tara:strand:- start:374 stop:868 length:495 start_codon:yes stop_codon:yes gene_type:complete
MEWLAKYDLIVNNILKKENNLVDINIVDLDDCIDKYILYGKKLKSYMSVTPEKIEILEKKDIKVYLIILLYCIFKFNQLKYSKSFEDTYKDCRDIFEKKNSDYGNSFLDFDSIGILVRLNDKINRTENLHKNNKVNNFEAIDDSIIDSFNYVILALVLLSDFKN